MLVQALPQDSKLSYAGVTQTSFGGPGSNVGLKINLNDVARAFFDVGKLSKILDEVGQFVEDRAKSGAPFRTGELRDSIGHQTTGMKVIIFAKADHAAPVEFGHVTKSGSFVAARPYMQPALEDGFPLLQTKIVRHAESVLAGRGGG